MTIGDLSQEITSGFFNRQDLVSVTWVQMLKAYKMIALKVPFDELRVKSAERTIDTASAVHDLSDIVTEIGGIQWTRITDASGNRRVIENLSTRQFDALQTTSTGGGPAAWARWGMNIEFDRPAPSTGWTVMFRYWKRPPIESLIEDTEILLPDEWCDLLFWETCYRIALILKDYDLANSLIQPMPMPRQQSPVKTRTFEVGIIPRLWNDLLKTIQDREGPGTGVATRPNVRPYR